MASVPYSEPLSGRPRATTIRNATGVHLVGIGGTGMSSLAGLLLEMGMHVTGSDLSPSTVVRQLETHGARIHIGHAAEYVEHPDLVVISSAISADNPEVQAAVERNIRVIKHAQALGELMRDRYGIAVAGTHGKSTTTALVAFLLHAAGRDPTLAGGAESVDFAASSRLGRSDYVIVEADEYDRRFLELAPRLAIVTSVEPDHLDYFGTFDEIVSAFQEFVGLLPKDGAAITCDDDPNVRRLEVASHRLSYGFDADASYRLVSFESLPGQPVRFTVRGPDATRHELLSNLLGRHNAANACAAIAAVREVGVGWDQVEAALPRFRGTRRRLEFVGQACGILIADDYAHHPTAMRVTLEAAKAWHGEQVWVAFQPHTTHRTAALLDDFASALHVPDRAFVLPIFQPTGREYEHRQVSADDLAARVPGAIVLGSLEDAATVLAAALRPGTLLVTMGAGDVTRLGPMVLEALRAQHP